VTTAPVLGPPGRAFPVASPRGRTGLLAVPLAGVAVAAAVAGLLAPPASLGVVLAIAGLAVLVGFQATLWTRQRRLTGALRRSQSSFQTLPLLRDMGHRYLQGYVFARPLEADQLAAGAWDMADAQPVDAQPVAALRGAPS
jgi:hypothetical protein